MGDTESPVCLHLNGKDTELEEGQKWMNIDRLLGLGQAMFAEGLSFLVNSLCVTAASPAIVGTKPAPLCVAGW